jgi:hypothetical protein
MRHRSTSNTDLNSGAPGMEFMKMFNYVNSDFTWDIITVSVKYMQDSTALRKGKTGTTNNGNEVQAVSGLRHMRLM